MMRRVKLMLMCCLPIAFIIFAAVVTEGQAEGLQARYLENSGSRSVLEITIENPPPSSVIVQQRIPQGARIKSAHPPYTKFAAGKNEVKWLLKRPVPGVQRIVLQFSAPLAGKGASAVIRCRNPRDGTPMTIHVQ